MYDRNQIIWPEQEPEPEFRFGITGTRLIFWKWTRPKTPPPLLVDLIHQNVFFYFPYDVLYYTVLYLGACMAPESHLEELEVGGCRPPCLIVFLYFQFNFEWVMNEYIISGLELKCPPLLLPLSSEKLAKSLQPTLESSSIQTAEPICQVSHHFINGKPCPFTTYFQIWFLILERVPKGGLKKLFFTYFLNLPNLCSPLWRALANHWTDCEVSLYCTVLYKIRGKKILCARGRGAAAGGYRGGGVKKLGVQFFFYYSVQAVGGAVGGGYMGGPL